MDILNRPSPEKQYSGDFSEISILRHALSYFKSLSAIDYSIRIFPNVIDDEKRDLIEATMIDSGFFNASKQGYNYVFKIKPEVFKSIKMSSVDDFLQNLINKSSQSREHESLNFQKLKLEVDKLSQEMKDYQSSKIQSKTAMIVSIVAAIIAGLALIIQVLQWLSVKKN